MCRGQSGKGLHKPWSLEALDQATHSRWLLPRITCTSCASLNSSHLSIRLFGRVIRGMALVLGALAPCP
jgi:hypothetical protein